MTEEEKGNEKKKKGFTWIDEVSEASQFACETAEHLSNCWSDFAGSHSDYMRDEGQYESRDVENGETDKSSSREVIIQKVNIVEEAVNRNQNSIEELNKKIDEGKNLPYWKRIVNSIVDDIPVTIFWMIVFAIAGYFLGTRS